MIFFKRKPKLRFNDMSREQLKDIVESDIRIHAMDCGDSVSDKKYYDGRITSAKNNINEYFDNPQERVIFHGMCLGCKSVEKEKSNNICKGCQFFPSNWATYPDLSS